ncbi:UNVERIFIED_CONTAM: Transcription factor SRM1 [Sesamum calycinum]|uniref:Transcription factor SRM1 n=1 Tax=Sesamum calycinum TaxID=2727403 RepID=A0AAW2LUA9_9LAMI
MAKVTGEVSRNLVVTRLPQQVASHAQKYFKRLNTAKESRKRSSIHDLTITDPDCLLVPAPTNHPVPPGFGNSEDLNRLMSWNNCGIQNSSAEMSVFLKSLVNQQFSYRTSFI